MSAATPPPGRTRAAARRDAVAVGWLAVVALAPLVVLTLVLTLMAGMAPAPLDGDTGAGPSFEASSLAIGGLHRMVCAALTARGVLGEACVVAMLLPSAVRVEPVPDRAVPPCVAVGPGVARVSPAAERRRLI